MKALVVAIMFLTRLPVPKLDTSQTDWKKSAMFFPFVGFIIGAILSMAALGLEKLFPLTVSAFLIVLLWIWITGGLHIDGWMDLADGFGSNRSREEILEIMKDSRVGAMGVIAAICLIFGKFIAVYELLRMGNIWIFLFCPLYARFILISAIKIWPYRKDGGLGEGLHTHLTIAVVLFNLVLLAVLTYFLLGLNGIFVFISTVLISGLFVLKIYKTLKMLTGDCYGALVEWSECIYLFVSLAVWRYAG